MIYAFCMWNVKGIDVDYADFITKRELIDILESSSATVRFICLVPVKEETRVAA